MSSTEPLPLAAASVPEVAPDAHWRRLSPRMLLVHPVREVGRAIPWLVGLLFAGSSSGHGHWLSLGALALVVALSVLRWFTTRYQITDEQVRLRTGVFRRRTITAPADRVRSVDVTAHALHRMLGLARVTIGTGASDRKRVGLVLDGLSTRAAGLLRAELLHRAAVAGVPGVAPVPASGWLPADWSPAAAVADEQLVSELDPRWIWLAPFTLSGAVTALAIIGFGWRVIDQAEVNAGRVGVIRSAADHLRHTPIWVDVVQVLIGAAVAVVLLSVFGYVLAFWNYRLTRTVGGSLHVSRGLITARATSISESRLRGVELSEPLLLRFVGGARLMAVATGLRVGRGAERGGTLLLPASPLSEAQRVARVVLADAFAGPGAGRLDHHGPVALRRRLVRTLVPSFALVLVFVALCAFGVLPLWLAVCSLVAPVLGVLLGLDRYASLGHGLTGGYLLTSYGTLVRRRVLLQTSGILAWNVRESFFQRRAGVCTLTATTAAGKQGYRVTDIEAGRAFALAEAATPGLLAEFLA